MKVKLNRVTLAFPQVHEPKVVAGQGDPAYSAVLILPPDHPDLPVLEAAIEEVAKDRWGQKAPEVLKQLRAKDYVCLHDGDSKSEYSGFPGNLFVSARTKVEPTLLTADRRPAQVKDGLFYAGALVNAVIDCWAQDNEYGKRINAGLGGLQWAGRGVPLAGGPRASADDFDDVEPEGDVW